MQCRGARAAAHAAQRQDLARGGNVYYTDIPNLWLLRDTNHDGALDKQEIQNLAARASVNDQPPGRGGGRGRRGGPPGPGSRRGHRSTRSS